MPGKKNKKTVHLSLLSNHPHDVVDCGLSNWKKDVGLSTISILMMLITATCGKRRRWKFIEMLTYQSGKLSPRLAASHLVINGDYMTMTVTKKHDRNPPWRITAKAKT